MRRGPRLSRGTLREAFRILVNSGLVEILPRKGLDRLRAVLESLGKLTIRYRYLGLELPGRMTTSLKAHQDTLRAFARRDSRTAGKVMLRLIESAGQAIVRHLFPEHQH